MDEFLREIHVSVLKEWILFQRFEGATINRVGDHIEIETECGLGHINFYEESLIELNVENTKTKEIVFFIHFQMNTINHALGLLKEMKECMLSLKDEAKLKVLLSCTSGFTTGFFADKLNEGAMLLNKEYEFNAVAYGELFDVAKDYDMILLAPQVSYMLSKVESVLKDKIVSTISSTLFGKYDVQNTFAFIEELANQNTIETADENPLPIMQPIKKHGKVLTLAFLIAEHKVRLVSRLYDGGNTILEDYEMFKNRISKSDMKEMISYIVNQYPDIELITLTMPGVVYHGTVTLKRYGFNNTNLLKYLQKYFNQQIVIINDVNAIVMGYYASQNQYKSISFLLQTHIGGKGGVGHIHDGQLIKGRHNIAGEIQYLPIQMSEAYEKLKKTPEGALEWTAKYCVSIACMIAPELIIITNKLILDENDVKNEMKKYMPEEYIPDILKIESMKEYMLVGSLLLGLN